MKYLSPILLALLISCANRSTDEGNSDLQQDTDQQFSSTAVICPIGYHTDSILDIEYGEPSEDLMADADSGLVWLGGCIPSDELHYCTIHNEAF